MLIMPLVIQNIENDNDRNFMEQLYLEHVRRMYSIARKYGATKDNEDDIVSDSVKSLIENIQELSSKSKQQLHTYIFVIVKNRTLDFNRKARREQDLICSDFFEALGNIAGPDTVEDLVLQSEKVCMIRNIAFSLPPIVQDVLRMKSQEHMSALEIAELTGLTENEIRNCLRKARYYIRKKANEESYYD